MHKQKDRWLDNGKNNKTANLFVWARGGAGIQLLPGQ